MWFTIQVAMTGLIYAASIWLAKFQARMPLPNTSMTAAQPDPSYANVLKVLWPSQGNFDVGEGHSERFVQSCSAQPTSAPNCLDLQSFTFWPEPPWELVLVFALGR